MPKEYKSISHITASLVSVDKVSDVSFNEFAEVELSNGERRRGKVIEISDDTALVELYDSTFGISTTDCKVRFAGKETEIALSEDMLGRIFDGLGKAIDGHSSILPEKRCQVRGSAVNPLARKCPDELIETGFSAVDCLTPIARGQKISLISADGLPYDDFVAQILNQAEALNIKESFIIIFAGIGLTFEQSEFYISSVKQSGAANRCVMFLSSATDPVTERIYTPRSAMTAAEFFAFDKNKDVLLTMTDMTNYANAIKEISAARKELPASNGYPVSMYSDLASIYERAGCLKNKTGSITLLPVITTPDGDFSKSVADISCGITDGQIVFSSLNYAKGIYPPVDVLLSASRYISSVLNEENSAISNQLISAYAKGKKVLELKEFLGKAVLSKTDKCYVEFTENFEKSFISQKSTVRSQKESYRLAWELLSILPENELKLIPKEIIEKNYLK